MYESHKVIAYLPQLAYYLHESPGNFDHNYLNAHITTHRYVQPCTGTVIQCMLLSHKKADSNSYTRTNVNTHLEHLTVLCTCTRDVRQLNMSRGKLVTLRQCEIKYCMALHVNKEI